MDGDGTRWQPLHFGHRPPADPAGPVSAPSTCTTPELVHQAPPVGRAGPSWPFPLRGRNERETALACRFFNRFTDRFTGHRRPMVENRPTPAAAGSTRKRGAPARAGAPGRAARSRPAGAMPAARSCAVLPPWSAQHLHHCPSWRTRPRRRRPACAPSCTGLEPGAKGVPLAPPSAWQCFGLRHHGRRTRCRRGGRGALVPCGGQGARWPPPLDPARAGNLKRLQKQ